MFKKSNISYQEKYLIFVPNRVTRNAKQEIVYKHFCIDVDKNTPLTLTDVSEFKLYKDDII